MLSFLVICVLSMVLFLSIALQKAYEHIPKKELRRRARRGDDSAKLLYKVVGFGYDVKIFLWLLIAVSSSLLFVLIAETLPGLMAFILVVSFVWISFVWLPNSQLSPISLRLAKVIAPALHWILERLHPVIKKVEHFINKHQPISIHTGLYTKKDILDLINQQKAQIDNRIPKDELAIVVHALQFGEKLVTDVMTPKRMTEVVKTTDMVGPVLMDKLHKSGFSRFPVMHDNPNQMVGTLYMKDLVGAKSGGFVKDIMKKKVFYVNQNQALPRVLDAFIKTKHHLYIVVNEFEEFVGLISIEDILEQVIGRQIIDEFDSYDDLREVAKMKATKDRKKNKTVVELGQEKSNDGSKE